MIWLSLGSLSLHHELEPRPSPLRMGSGQFTPLLASVRGDFLGHGRLWLDPLPINSFSEGYVNLLSLRVEVPEDIFHRHHQVLQDSWFRQTHHWGDLPCPLPHPRPKAMRKEEST